MTDRLTVDTITSDQLDALYDDRDRLGYEVQQWKDTYGEHALRDTLARLNGAEAAVERVREALSSLRRTMAHDPRDWGRDKRDAWLWAIVCGWECEAEHDHDVIRGRDNPLRQVATRHGWADEDIERLKTYRAAVAALDEPKEH